MKGTLVDTDRVLNLYSPETCTTWGVESDFSTYPQSCSTASWEWRGVRSTGWKIPFCAEQMNEKKDCNSTWTILDGQRESISIKSKSETSIFVCLLFVWIVVRSSLR